MDASKGGGSKKRSAVWFHFSQEGSKGICKYCDKVISVKNGNVSNLSRHVKVKHPTVDVSPVVFIQGDPPSMLLEVEEEPAVKSETDASYRLKWTSKSELRERRRIRNTDNRIKQIREDESRMQREYYDEQMDDTEEYDPLMETVETVTDALPADKPNERPSLDDDSDRHFLLSLVPLMKKLSPEDNMDIRIQIQNSFKDKLFPPKNQLAEN